MFLFASAASGLGAEGFSFKSLPQGGAEELALSFGELELNGILLFGERSKFAFVDKRSGKTFWVQQGERLGGLLVEGFDEERGVATLRKGAVRHRYHLAVSSGPVSTYDIVARKRDQLIEENLAMDMAVSHESRRQRLREKRQEDRELRIALAKKRAAAARAD